MKKINREELLEAIRLSPEDLEKVTGGSSGDCYDDVLAAFLTCQDQEVEHSLKDQHFMECMSAYEQGVNQCFHH